MTDLIKIESLLGQAITLFFIFLKKISAFRFLLIIN